MSIVGLELGVPVEVVVENTIDTDKVSWVLANLVRVNMKLGILIL